MDWERRHFLLAAALASATLSSRGGASPAESDASVLDPPASSHPSPADDLVFVLNPHRRAPEPAAGPDAALTYGDPGPVLRLKRGGPVRLRLVNGLPEATGLDWHGMRLPNALETIPGLIGGPLAPGRTGEIALTPGDSGSFWFHPPLISGLSNQTSRGLAGVVIVEDPSDPPVDSDRILFLTDAPSWLAHDQPPAGAPGDRLDSILVNGKAVPDVDLLAPGTRLRLRIINGSTRLALAVTFEGAHPMVVAIDGQPSERFAPLNDTVPVGPGARFDVVVDLPRTPGREFKALLRAPETGFGSRSDRSSFVARTEGTPRPEPGPIPALAPNPSLPRYIPLERSTRADMVVVRPNSPKSVAGTASWTVNGFGGETLPKRPLFSVRRNTPVTLGFSNRSTELTAFRLHGHVMRLLHAMDDGWEPYWRDSVLVPAGATHHAAFVADNPGRWLIASPFFDQAVKGLRTWFEVL